MTPAAVRKAWWNAVTSPAPATIGPEREDAAMTVTSTATPRPPATRVWVLNRAEARPVSAGEMVANDEVWTAMLHQAMPEPLQNARARISQVLVPAA